MINKTNFIIKTLFFFFLIILFSNHTVFANNKMLAVINDNYVIFDYDLNKEIKFQKILNPKEKIDTKNLKHLMLNQMIINQIILDDSKKFNISVSYAEVNSAIKYIEESNKLAPDSLIKNAQSQGISKEEFYKMLKDVLTVDKMKQTMSFSRAKVSNNEAVTELRRVLSLNGKAEMELYEISISFNNKTQEEAKKEIDIIYDELKKGANFNVLAKKFSESINASEGGEIGWVPEIFLSSETIININTLQLNEYSKPFVSEKSYKIILLKDARPLLYIDINNPEHIEKLTNYAKQKVMNDKAQVYLEDYLNEVRQRASVTTYEENLK